MLIPLVLCLGIEPSFHVCCPPVLTNRLPEDLGAGTRIELVPEDYETSVLPLHSPAVCETDMMIPSRMKDPNISRPFKSPRSDLNRRPAVYKTAALPLSYKGILTNLNAPQSEPQIFSCVSACNPLSTT